MRISDWSSDVCSSDLRVEVTTHSIDLATDCASADLASAVGDREIGTYIYNAGADTRADRFVDLPVDAWSGMVRRNVLTMMESCHFFAGRSEEHTSELQSLMRISYAVFCLKKKKT